jgi:hypothetical protein
MSEERVRAALREIAAAAPLHPDAEAAMSAAGPTAPAQAHPRGRRPWLAPSLAAASVILTLVAVALVRLSSIAQPPATGADDGPTLPDRFPAFSFLQGTTGGRFGRAIALYTNGTGHEDFSFSQLILAAADGDRYRRLDVPADPNGGLVPARLSQDGTTVAIGGSGITVLDLITGGTDRFPIPATAGVVPLAFSPDGTRVAYTTRVELGGTGPLSILDIADGKTTPITGESVSAAAFSPDGARIAFQPGSPPAEEIRVSRLDGTLAGRITVPPRTELAGSQAWSPDGRYLVAVTYGPDRPVGDGSYASDPSYMFLDASASAGPAPAAIPAKDLTPRAWGDPVLGWRSDATMLVSTGDVDGTTSNLIVAVNIADGGHQVISRFAVGPHDDLAVGGVQLASALVPGAGVRHSADPDRGPWPTWAIVTSAVCLGVCLAGPLLWWIRRRRAG